MLCRTGGYKRASVTQRGDKDQLVMLISIIHYGDTAQDVCDLNVGLGKFPAIIGGKWAGYNPLPP